VARTIYLRLPLFTPDSVSLASLAGQLCKHDVKQRACFSELAKL